MFKIHCSNCSVSNSSWCLNTQSVRGFAEYLFLLIFQKQDTQRPSSFCVNMTVNWGPVIRNPKTFCQHLDFFAALYTYHYEMKSWTWNPFTLCPKCYIPLQHLCKTLQQLTHWCDPHPHHQNQSKLYCNHRKSLSWCPAIYHVQQYMQEYQIMEDLTDFKLCVHEVLQLF